MSVDIQADEMRLECHACGTHTCLPAALTAWWFDAHWQPCVVALHVRVDGQDAGWWHRRP